MCLSFISMHLLTGITKLSITMVFSDPMSFNIICFFKFMCSSEYSAKKFSLEIALKVEVQGVQVRTVGTPKAICSKTDPSVLKMIIDPLQIFHRTRGWARTVLLEHCSCIIRAEYSLKVNKKLSLAPVCSCHC